MREFSQYSDKEQDDLGSIENRDRDFLFANISRHNLLNPLFSGYQEVLSQR
jgi:hypothetical protein